METKVGKITAGKLRDLGKMVVLSGIKAEALPSDFEGVLLAYIDNVVDNFAKKGEKLTVDSFCQSVAEESVLLLALFDSEITLAMIAIITTIWLKGIPTADELLS